MARLQIRHKNRGNINRRKSLTERNIDGKSSAAVHCENVSTQMRDTDASFVIQIDGGEKQPMLRFYFNDELLFSMDLNDAVGAAKDVRSDAKFKSRLGQDADRGRMTGGLGSARRRRIIHLTTPNHEVLRSRGVGAEHMEFHQNIR